MGIEDFFHKIICGFNKMYYFCKKNKKPLKKFAFIFMSLLSLMRWMLANAVLPIILPVAFIWGMEMLFDGTSDFCATFMKLLREGFYIFSSLTLACSLLEDYSVFQKTIKWYESTLITVLMIATGIMFYCMERYEPGYFYNNFDVFKWMWIGLALISSEVKLRMILKNKNL